MIEEKYIPEYGTCPNCKREGRALIKHHIVPREKNGIDYPENRLKICSACERFLHAYFGNGLLSTELNTADKVLSNKDFKLWGEFLVMSMFTGEMLRDMSRVLRYYELWKSRDKHMGGIPVLNENVSKAFVARVLHATYKKLYGKNRMNKLSDTGRGYEKALANFKMDFWHEYVKGLKIEADKNRHFEKGLERDAVPSEVK